MLNTNYNCLYSKLVTISQVFSVLFNANYVLQLTLLTTVREQRKKVCLCRSASEACSLIGWLVQCATCKGIWKKKISFSLCTKVRQLGRYGFN